MEKVKGYIRKNFPLFLMLIQTLILTKMLIAPKTDLMTYFINSGMTLLLMAVLILLPIGYVAASIIETVVIFAFYYINEFLMNVRMRPLNYMDFFCIKDAANVKGSYSVVITLSIVIKLIISLLITAAVCFLVIKFYKKPEKKYTKPVSALAAGVLAFGMLIFYNVLGYFDGDPLIWDENEYMKNNGLFFSLYNEYQNSKVIPPDGYSGKKAISYLEKYPTVAAESKTPTNIIVIMDEAFADYSLIGDNGIKEDPLKAIRTLEGNFKEGKLAVDVYGGSTCNSEFEFLTGCSLAFLPQNDIPYIRHDLSGLSSMGNDLKGLGYKSVPIHPYIAAEWRRTTIYPNWFTEDFISGEEFGDADGDYDEIFEQNKYVNFGDGLEYIRHYISDAESFRKVAEEMTKFNSQNDKSFIFNITMQNHGGYDADKIGDLKVKDFSDDESLNIYLTLSEYTSEAYVDLIHSLEDYSEPTVVLMFGDHQPGLSTFTPRSDEKQESLLERTSNKYIVPYMLWSNYDIDWDIPDFLSINYLSAVLKKNCGLELTPFDSMRLKAMEEYPVLTYLFSVNKDGKFVETDTAKQSDIIKEYEMIQYYKMFDN